MKGNHDNYYQSIGFLGDSIKQNCPWKKYWWLISAPLRILKPTHLKL
jgi:hypothetical protein